MYTRSTMRLLSLAMFGPSLAFSRKALRVRVFRSDVRT
jgi:hypothetical protein